MTAGALPAAARLGPAHLVVGDLDRSLRFYESVLGLRPHDRDGATASVGDGEEDLLVLHADPVARAPGRHSGLYHVALLYPTRLELARAAQRLSAAGAGILGASDHGTHEAIYLADPDMNGLELAADRPPAEWISFEEELRRGGPAPLDLAGLFELLGDQDVVEHAEAGTRVGHVHLHVGDVRAASAFYTGVVGFDLRIEIPQVVFVAAGGYHHHVACNTWRGAGIPAAPADGVLGLRHFTLLLPSAADVGSLRGRLESAGVDHREEDGALAVRDPAGNAMLVRVDHRAAPPAD